MQTMENSISPLCKICLVENNSITSLRNSLKTIKPNKLQWFSSTFLESICQQKLMSSSIIHLIQMYKLTTHRTCLRGGRLSSHRNIKLIQFFPPNESQVKEESFQLNRRTFWPFCQRKVSMTGLHNPDKSSSGWFYPTTLPTYYTEIIVACLKLLFLPFVLSFIAPVAQQVFLLDLLISLKYLIQSPQLVQYQNSWPLEALYF